MLRKRSRVPSKQAIVGDNHSNHSWLPPENQAKPSTFYFTSRIFQEFFTRMIDPMMSPASILDKNPFSLESNFLVFDNKTTKNTIQQRAWEQPNSKQGIGLALIDENCETNNAAITTKQQRRKLVVFGVQLRILVPCLSPESPREFGIKTPRNNVWPFGSKDSHTQVHPVVSYTKNESISMHDIDEESEDYTCVISHGSNPKTTHIFGNCIVENCCGKIAGLPSCASRRNGNFTSLGDLTPSKDDFLSFCYHCKKKLAEGRDIYMYRGEKAFCSEECRCQEMLFDVDES